MEQLSGDTNVTYHVTMKVHGDKMRMDQRTSTGNAFSVIIDLNTRDSITLMPNEKAFLKRSGAEIRQQMEADAKASHGTKRSNEPPARAVDTGRTAKAGGYDTEIYTWSGPNGLTETLWVAKDFPAFDAIRPELAKLDRFDDTGPHRSAQPELSRLPGMVVQTEKVENGQRSVINLVSAKAESLDAGLFELPADYSLWKSSASSQKTNTAAAPAR